jgi:insertion element IS1 protein InsB
MLNSCKHCGSNKLVKNGITLGKQRYRCNSCRKNSSYGDKRQKFGLDKQLKVIRCYLEGVGIRSISRLEGVSPPLILRWIKNTAKIIKDKLLNAANNSEKQHIEILEIDELFSYCQKKLLNSSFGLLLIGSEIKLLTLKSAKKEISNLT